MALKKIVEVKKNSSENKLLETLIFSPIFLIFLLCPLFFTNLTAQGIGFDKMFLFFSLTLIGLVAWATKSIIIGELSIKKSFLNLFIWITGVIFLISSFLSISQKDSFIGSYGNISKGFVAFLTFVLFYYLVVNNVNIARVKILFWTFLSSVFLVIVYSFLQLLGLYILPWQFTHSINFNPLGSISSLSIFLASVLPLWVVVLSQIKKIHPKITKTYLFIVKLFSFVAIIISLITLHVLSGFTYWPIVIVGVAIVLFFFLTKVVESTNVDMSIPVVAFFLLIILSVLGNFNVLKLNLPAEVSLSTEASFDIAKNSLKENPFFGSGLSTFYYNFNKFKNIDFNNSTLWNIQFDNSSGLLSDIAATAGFLGLAMIIVIILKSIYLFFSVTIKAKLADMKPILLALASSFIVAILFSIFFSLNNSLILFFVLMSSLGLATVFVSHPKEVEEKRLSLKASPKYATMLAVVFLLVSSGVIILLVYGAKMYGADIYIKQAMASQDINIRIEKTNKAISLAPFQDSYYLLQSSNYLILASQEAQKENNQSNVVDGISVAISAGNQALSISPKNIINIKNLATVYENVSMYVNGSIEWAEMLYKNILELSPNNPEPYLKIGIINMTRANAENDKEEQKRYIEEAIKNYDEAILKKVNMAVAYYAKAIALEALGNTDLAIEELKKAVIADNTNTDYQFELGRLYLNKGITPSLSQTAVDEIITGEDEQGDLSVEQESVVAQNGKVSRNENINIAEQLFFNILSINQNHANAKYALGLLYQKTGEKERAGAIIKSLLETLQDEQGIEAVKKQFPGLY